MEQRLNYLIAGTFIALIFATIIFVTMLLPASTFKPVPSEVAYRYQENSPELRGRDIYRREGCFYCHTQFSRYQDRDMGELVAAGDYVYETPHLLGTERSGPDLSNIGGKYPDGWHWAHHKDPRRVKPGSIMPSFEHLTDQEMKDLIAYLQTIGRKRKVPSWIVPPQEIRDKYKLIAEKVGVNMSASANAGRGIYQQNCAQCHGVNAQGNGPVSTTMMKKPANFRRPFFKAYSDEFWFWRIAEGVPGTRMPRWGKSLSDEDMLYLVAYLKTLPYDDGTPSGKVEVTNFSQVDDPKALSHNYEEIEALKPDPNDPYAYGGSRP